MFIRATPFVNKKNGKTYNNYRLVESYRNQSGKVRQSSILTLGADFSVDKSKWRLLADRIEEICSGQGSLIPLEAELEKKAEAIAKLVTQKSGAIKPVNINQATAKDFQSVDLDSLEHQDIRQIGAEYLGASAAKQLNLKEILLSNGFNEKQANIALGSIIAKLIHPGSELSTHRHLTSSSALDEVLDTDFTKLPLKSLYKISDQLLKHKEEIEEALYKKEKDLFNLKETITLYDITNSYFEGRSTANPKARLGRSKEKRSDCPLVSLGMVLDSSGFPKTSKILPGNVSEPKTLSEILLKLKAKPGVTIVMDAGFATEENITWLKENNYEYIVVSRKRSPMPDNIDSILVKDDPGNRVEASLVKNEETDELELYCHSQAKEAKSEIMESKFTKRFEDELQKLINGLTKARATKDYEKILTRIGRIKEKYSRVSKFYDVSVKFEEDSKKKKQVVTNITWKKIKDTNKLGIYCLRTNKTNLGAKEFWKTYTMLTELESAFRHLKSELGLRPIYHQKEDRVDGHIFITILAYHLLHTIRYQLKQKGINQSWKIIREIMSTQCRVTSTLELEDSRIVNIRKTSKANAEQMVIYNALDINSIPGETKKTYF
jgi:transposase